MVNPEIPAGGATGGAARGSSSPRFRIVVGLGGLLLVAAALALWLRPDRWLWPDRPPPAAPVVVDDDDPDQVLAVVNPGYVGIEVCAECHAERAAVVKTSRHYLACRPATGAAAPGFKPGRGLFTTRVPGMRFEMTRTGNDFFATGVQATAQGEERVSYQIGLVYGSAGKRDEMYFAWQDDRLYHLPVAWLYPFDRWGHAVNSIHGRETPPSCLECHNTWVAHVPGSANRYRRDDMILGVTCERCHGPGREHVEYHRAHPDDPAHAILHPGTLSRERKMDVCGQCHGNTRALGTAFSYRPGQPLDAYFHNVHTKYPEDDTTNQVRYLGESKCFQKNSTMTCITCHDPHRPKSRQGGCYKCHTAAACTEQPRLPEAVRGDCVGCHMPPRVWMHVHFYSTTDDQYLPIAPRADHRIGVYPEAKQAVLLAWRRKQNDTTSRAEAERLAAQLTQHWLNEAEHRRRAGRFKAAIGAFREALQVEPNPTTRQRLQEVIARQNELDDLVIAETNVDRRHPEEAIRLLKKVLKIKPDYAYAHGELGTIYAMTGRRDEAITHLQAVAQCDPNDSHGVTMLASMAYIDGRLEEAAALCAKAQEIEPGHARNHYIWGQALMKLERWEAAAEQFRKTLVSNPTHGGGNQGLSEVLRRQGKAAEAVRFARRAVRWSDPRNADVLLTLADAYLGAKRAADARTTLEKALDVAETNNPALVPTILERLRTLPQS